MGDSEESYPDGTMYLCNFSGKFTDIKQLDDHSYSLTLDELTSDYEQGKEWVEDGVRYVSSGALWRGGGEGLYPLSA